MTYRLLQKKAIGAMTTASGAAFLNEDQTWRSSNYRRHEATHILYREACVSVRVHTFSDCAHSCIYSRLYKALLFST